MQISRVAPPRPDARGKVALKGTSAIVVPTCPICLSLVRAKPFVVKKEFDIYMCRTCEHLFVFPVPDDEELTSLYSFENMYMNREAVLYTESTPLGPRKRETLSRLSTIPAPRRILDVGCASGEFLWSAKQSGWEVFGVELNKDTANIAKRNAIDVFVGELAEARLPRDHFDAIHLGDVIEHVVDPRSLLLEAMKSLTSQGVIAIVTPNWRSPFPWLTLQLYRLFKIPWSHVMPPHHLHQFSHKSLSSLLKSVGAQAIQVEYWGPNLTYELDEIGIPIFSTWDSLRALARGNRRAALRSLVVRTLYTASYAVSRVWPQKRDCAMRLYARRAMPPVGDAIGVGCPLENDSNTDGRPADVLARGARPHARSPTSLGAGFSVG